MLQMLHRGLLVCLLMKLSFAAGPCDFWSGDWHFFADGVDADLLPVAPILSRIRTP
jgi:hypothetical protein